MISSNYYHHNPNDISDTNFENNQPFNNFENNSNVDQEEFTENLQYSDNNYLANYDTNNNFNNNYNNMISSRPASVTSNRSQRPSSRQYKQQQTIIQQQLLRHQQNSSQDNSQYNGNYFRTNTNNFNTNNFSLERHQGNQDSTQFFSQNSKNLQSSFYNAINNFNNNNFDDNHNMSFNKNINNNNNLVNKNNLDTLNYNYTDNSFSLSQTRSSSQLPHHPLSYNNLNDNQNYNNNISNKNFAYNKINNNNFNISTSNSNNNQYHDKNNLSFDVNGLNNKIRQNNDQISINSEENNPLEQKFSEREYDNNYKNNNLTKNNINNFNFDNNNRYSVISSDINHTFNQNNNNNYDDNNNNGNNNLVDKMSQMGVREERNFSRSSNNHQFHQNNENMSKEFRTNVSTLTSKNSNNITNSNQINLNNRVSKNWNSSDYKNIGDLELSEVINILNHEDDLIKMNACQYLQHLSYMDDNVKAQTRTLKGIGKLLDLLSSGNRDVHQAALGALRNISYGKANDQNKREIYKLNGIAPLTRLLRNSPRDMQLLEAVTGIIWNLSSCIDLKRSIIDNSLKSLLDYAIIPFSPSNYNQQIREDIQNKHTYPNSNQPVGDEFYNSVIFRNSTGVLRNISSEGDYARKKMRCCENLIEVLIDSINESVAEQEFDGKSVENCVCVLRNLSFACEEISDPDYLNKRLVSTTDHESNTGCFGNKSKVTNKIKNELKSQRKHPTENDLRSNPNMKLLWKSEILNSYLPLIKNSNNSETLEASVGAIQNLSACDWQPAIEIRKKVRIMEGMPLIINLLNYSSDRVIGTTATALRNLAVDDENKTLIENHALKDLVSLLPKSQDPSEIPISNETIASIESCLFELTKNNNNNNSNNTNINFIRSLVSNGGLERLVNLSHGNKEVFDQKVVRIANQLLLRIKKTNEFDYRFKRLNWTPPEKNMKPSKENTLIKSNNEMKNSFYDKNNSLDNVKYQSNNDHVQFGGGNLNFDNKVIDEDFILQNEEKIDQIYNNNRNNIKNISNETQQIRNSTEKNINKNNLTLNNINNNDFANVNDMNNIINYKNTSSYNVNDNSFNNNINDNNNVNNVINNYSNTSKMDPSNNYNLMNCFVENDDAVNNIDHSQFNNSNVNNNTSYMMNSNINNNSFKSTVPRNFGENFNNSRANSRNEFRNY